MVHEKMVEMLKVEEFEVHEKTVEMLNVEETREVHEKTVEIIQEVAEEGVVVKEGAAV